ncbi:NifB/NifX family molybdenum-iron cluster-binding protein [Pectobacteriaceae bacterium CE90]|nr:NifB/NifX family molybdenum-iron cluster-binding protein [Pectobacteriaceae bacterium CE90]
MITAIPMNEDRIAGHFTKALSIAFINEHGTEISRHANPALDTNCTGKQQLIELLLEQQADHIIVRNIGTQMLGRLLEHHFQVFQLDGRQPDTLKPDDIPVTALTEASQGKASPNHANKPEGGCGCHHHDDNPATGGIVRRCCQQDAIHAPGHSACHSGGNKSGHGHGKCCHS